MELIWIYTKRKETRTKRLESFTFQAFNILILPLSKPNLNPYFREFYKCKLIWQITKLTSGSLSHAGLG